VKASFWKVGFVVGMLLVFLVCGQAVLAKVTITFAHFLPESDPRWVYWNQVIEEYMKTHPDVEIVQDVVSHDEYLNVKFKTMAATDTLPELFVICSMDMRSAVYNKRLMDWTEIVNSDPGWRDSFLPGLFAETTFGDRVYAIPWQFILNETLVYNTEIFQKVGLDRIPESWEEFMNVCQKLKDAGYIPMALGAKAGWPMVSFFVEVLCEYICGKEWVDEIGSFTGKASFDDPRFVEVLKTFKYPVDKGYFNPDLISIDNSEAAGYFYAGQAAILPQGSWVTGMIATDAPDMLEKVSVAPIPRPANALPEVKYGIFTGGSGWELACNTRLTEEQKKVCVDLVKAFTSVEFAKRHPSFNWLPFAKVEIGPDEGTRLLRELYQLVLAAPAIRPMNQEQCGPGISDALYKKLQEMVVGSITPEQAAKDIQAVYEKVVEAEAQLRR